MRPRSTRSLLARVGLVLALAGASVAHAQTSLTLDVDPAQSTLSVGVSFSGVSLSDDSPASGYLVVQIDNEAAPSQGVLLDYRFALDEPILLEQSFFPLGDFTANGTNIVLLDGAPCDGAGPAAIAPNGDGTVPGVLATTEGLIDYVATGIPCAGLTGQSLPCTDMIDLTTDFPDPVVGSLSGTFTVAGGSATLVTPVDIFNPFDPLDPAAGGSSIVGTSVATGPRGQACSPADGGPVDGSDCRPDGAVALSDFSLYLSRWANSDPAADITPAGTCLPGQGTDGVDLSDFSCFLSLWANGCS